MEVREKLQQFIARIPKLKESISTEEATKTSLIMPFFQLLGYDVFNPLEFIPEFTADVGIKKGEKVDYAIVIEDVPTILIECKPCSSDLNKYTSQLFRYFGTSTAKFAILTNGIQYKFFTDLEEPNKMDPSPFLTIDLLNLRDRDLNELLKFTKSNLDVVAILDSAENLKYGLLIKEWFASQLSTPDSDFIRLILNSIYDGVKTQKVVDSFAPIVSRSLNQYINDVINEKLKTALNTNESEDAAESNTISQSKKEESKIITTIDELEAFAIIKSILRNEVDPSRIFYRDTQSYFGILLDDNNRKWICRITAKDTLLFFTIPDENKKEIRYNLNNLNDLYKYSTEIVNACKKYIN